MAISTEVRFAGPYKGNGSATIFPFEFVVLNKDDVQVTVGTIDSNVEDVLEYGYTVRLNADQDNDPGGEIELDEPLGENMALAITTNMPNLQELVLTNRGGFYPESVNDAFDKVVIMIQQLKVRESRALYVPLTSEQTPQEALAQILDIASKANELNEDSKRINEEIQKYKKEIEQLAEYAHGADKFADAAEEFKEGAEEAAERSETAAKKSEASAKESKASADKSEASAKRSEQSATVSQTNAKVASDAAAKATTLHQDITGKMVEIRELANYAADADKYASEAYASKSEALKSATESKQSARESAESAEQSKFYALKSGFGFRYCAAATALETIYIGNVDPSDLLKVGDHIVNEEGEIFEVESINDKAQTCELSDVIACIRGPNGKDGKDGKDGERGPQGEPGPQGQVGEKGPMGDAPWAGAFGQFNIEGCDLMMHYVGLDIPKAFEINDEGYLIGESEING